MPFGRPFRSISLGVPFPGLKPLGCFLFALRALGARTRKCPNSRDRASVPCPKQDRIRLPAGLDVLNRPKGENRIAHGLQPWEDVPERNRPPTGRLRARPGRSKWILVSLFFLWVGLLVHYAPCFWTNGDTHRRGADAK